VAREVAAILGQKLAPYPVVELGELEHDDLPAIPIEIDDPDRCPRYTGLKFSGVKAQAAPLWMQARLGHIGMRPIDCLVDLTNYIMAELGQPMHAFDGDKVDRIEVGSAEPGSTFTTLDGAERVLPEEALMILCHRRPVALAGIMGGLETEVSPRTQTMLLESANFEPAQIRRCATALGLRTEASTRFEKSLDPAHTVLAIQRFFKLAQPEFPQMVLASRLSDCYPRPAPELRIDVDPAFVRRFMGHPTDAAQITRILQPLGFRVEAKNDKLVVTVPSYRATKDVSIEADVIEEVARYIGYENIEPILPEVTVRCFEPNAQHRLERDTLAALCLGQGYSEVQAHIWTDQAWADRLGIDVSAAIELRNPSAAGQAHLRQTLLPGMLAATDRNRLHTDQFKVCEVGTVFTGDAQSKDQERHLGLISAKRGKKLEDGLLAGLRGALDTWSWQVLGVPAVFEPLTTADGYPWLHEHRSAGISIADRSLGAISVVPLALRRRIDEHLGAWAIAWAEINLNPLTELAPEDAHLGRVPEYPEVQLDFSILVGAGVTYREAAARLAGFDHPLLQRLSFLSAYQGGSIPSRNRSLTFRAKIGAPDRTLVDQDLAGFRKEFEQYIADNGFALR
jgi:phenylalanyl-tRNA synthetase beta chain